MSSNGMDLVRWLFIGAHSGDMSLLATQATDDGLGFVTRARARAGAGTGAFVRRLNAVGGLLGVLILSKYQGLLLLLHEGLLLIMLLMGALGLGWGSVFVPVHH